MSAATEALAAGSTATTGAEGGQQQQQAAAPALPEWANGLAPEVATWFTNKKFENPQAALTSQFNLEKMLGQDKIVLPKDASDKAGWDAVFKRLGRPDKPDAYFEGAADVFPEGFKPDDGLLKGFTELAHKIGLNTEQARALAKWQVETALSNGTTQEQQDAEWDAKSKSEWDGLVKELGSQKFDALVSDMQRAARLVSDIMPPETADAIERAIGTKAFVQLFGKLGSAFGKEMGFVEGQQPGGKPTPEMARAKIASLGQDKAWMDRYVKGDVAARREMEELHKIAAGQ